MGGGQLGRSFKLFNTEVGKGRGKKEGGEIKEKLSM
jgi:hypothetical protein